MAAVSAVIYYRCERSKVISALAQFHYNAETEALVPAQTGRALNREYEEKLTGVVIRRILHKFLLPMPLRKIISIIKSIRYLRKGLKSLLHGKLEVDVLDAVAIAVSILRGDFQTDGHIKNLLTIWLVQWHRVPKKYG